MKFLKVLINSLISGIFFCGLLGLLTLGLNIGHSFSPSFLGQLTLFLAAVYGVLIALACMILFFIIQFFLGKKINISFISPSFLSLSFSLLVILFLILFKANRDFYQSFFEPKTAALLKTQGMIFITLTLLGFFAFYSYQSYKRKVSFFLGYFLLLWGGLCLALFLRMKYPEFYLPEKISNLEAKKIDKKITVIGLEGLSFDFLIPLINDEKLPNFSLLLEGGSWGKLENFSPNEPVVLNNSFNTGKLPFKHRQLSLFKYSFFRSPRTFEVIPRYIFFRQLTRMGALQISPNPNPKIVKDIWQIFEENQTPYLRMDWPYNTTVRIPNPRAESLFVNFYDELKLETSGLFNKVRLAFYADAQFEEEFARERERAQPQLSYLLLKGLNDVESFFYKYSFPDLYGNIDQEEINKYSSVIESYYQFYDQIIGRYLASLKMDELLVVYSPHGIEPLPLWKRFVEWILGNADISAYHEHSPEGVIFCYGKDIVRGQNIEGMKIIDVAPTLLNYLGLPVGRDMDGVVNSSIFVHSLKIENPVLYISSYEEVEIKPSK